MHGIGWIRALVPSTYSRGKRDEIFRGTVARLRIADVGTDTIVSPACEGAACQHFAGERKQLTRGRRRASAGTDTTYHKGACRDHADASAGDGLRLDAIQLDALGPRPGDETR